MDAARLVLNADGSYSMHTNLSISETVERMRAALDHAEALHAKPTEQESGG